MPKSKARIPGKDMRRPSVGADARPLLASAFAALKAGAVGPNQQVGRQVQARQPEGVARKASQVKQIELGFFAPPGDQHGFKATRGQR